MLNRTRLMAIAMVVCLFAVLAAGSVAYFTAEETAYNVISTGVLDIELHEETDEGRPFPAEGIKNAVPGDVVGKEVTVENTGTVDTYVRIAVETKMTAEDGTELSTDVLKMDFDTKNWTEKDGWFYYNVALKPGEETPALFTAVTFDSAMGNEYMSATAQVNVNVQAVQSRNNDAGGVLGATGWPQE